MIPSFTAATRDSLSNLAASLGAGKDKAAGDSFYVFDLDRAQVEAMYRGDWLARKVVDIVPYDMVRAWREWSGHPADVAGIQAAERRLGLRRALQRALTLGRLYGGAAIVIGTGERDPAALARPLHPDALGRGGLKFLHVVSRWQLGAPAVDRDPLSPWYGDASAYEVVAPDRGALVLHPSRVVRFLGNPWPDPTMAATVWSDSILQALYDAIHAVALTTAGATSLMHEAKVDVVTVPNLSEHLSSADTTAQLSARFAYAASGERMGRKRRPGRQAHGRRHDDVRAPGGSGRLRPGQGHEGAVVLATSLDQATAREIVNTYANRWTIETSFRDTKDLRFGMGLAELRISRPDRRDRLLLLNAFAIYLLTMLGTAGESLGMDRHLRSGTSKRRTHSLFRQGAMLYELIPNMPEIRLRPLMLRLTEIMQHSRAISALVVVS